MDAVLDHLMWGAPSLDAGIAEAERLFGVRPAEGGSHPGLGTRNALLSLGEAVYLEIIAPDPHQDLEGNFGGRLSQLEAPGLITWAASSPDLRGLASEAVAAGLSVRGPVPTKRAAPDGSMLHWELLFPGGHDHGTLVPFFIDWLATPHPATTNPRGGTLAALRILSPAADDLNRLFSALHIGLTAESAAAPGLEARIETDGGPVILTAAPGTSDWSLLG